LHRHIALLTASARLLLQIECSIIFALQRRDDEHKQVASPFDEATGPQIAQFAFTAFISKSAI